MLVEIAIGDAYGAGQEFCSPEEVAAKNDLSGYTKHPTHNLRAGQYTDDTQMSIAIVEALMGYVVDAHDWTPDVLAHHFVSAFKRDWRDGYARGFQKLLEEVKSGDELRARLVPSSDKSGAAMRATPIGLLLDEHRVMTFAQIQGEITHNTPDGIAAAQAAAMMTHFLAFGYPIADLRAFLSDWLPKHADQFQQPWVGRILAPGLHSVRAALEAIVSAHIHNEPAPTDPDYASYRSLSEILQRVVAFTGDTDTAAAIAMGAACLSPHIQNDLPDVLRYGLERGPFGYDFLYKLDKTFMQVMEWKPKSRRTRGYGYRDKR